MALKLFRRHESKGSRGYAKDFRIYEHDSPKTTKRSQCNCPISAEGKLATGIYIRPKSTGQRTWDLARIESAKWEQAGRTQPPEAAGYKLIPVKDAVDAFYANTRENGASKDRMTALEYLFTLRLIPYAKEHRIVHPTDGQCACMAEVSPVVAQFEPTTQPEDRARPRGRAYAFE